MRRFRLIVWMALVVCCAGLTASAAPAPKEGGFEHPVLRVPKMDSPPVIDGRISEGEYARAAAVTGFAAGGPGSSMSLVPEIQQVVWYLGFDERFLYLAMRSPQKKGTYPVARCKENDSMAVLFEDHVEVQICPFPREKATRPGTGFFKMMVNPKAAMIDQYLFNGTVGTEELWSTGGEAKCTVTEDHWDLEMAVEIRRLKVDKLDGRDLTIQLVRTDSCTGIYFAGWVPASWLEWKRFAQVDFDSKAPVFQFLRTGEIMEGNLDTLVRLAGTGAGTQDIKVEVAVEDASGKPIYKEEQTASVRGAESKDLRFRKEGLPVSPVSINDKERNTFEIRASYRDGGKTLVLYHNRTPFVKLDEAFRKKYLDPWLAGRPQSGDWECRVAYSPYHGKMDAGVDLDFFGMAPEVLAAGKFRLAVYPAAGGKPLGEATADLTALKGWTLLSLPDLPEGEYDAVVTLLDPAGRKTVSEKKLRFVRKKYEWEHNTLGISDEVIPPFTPMKVAGQNVLCWGRTLTVGKGGLPDQIVAGQPTGTFGAPERLLAAPVRLVVTQGGKTVEAAGTASKLTDLGGHRVDIEGTLQAGALAIATRAFEEYDGWYQVELVAAPETLTPVDAMDLVIDLRNLPVDTLYVQRLGDGRYGNYFGGIPAKPGVCFESTSLLKSRAGGKDWKSFVPITYVGNGDRGLWFFAWSDAGWELRDDQPTVQVERQKDGTVRLRVRLLAGPVTLEKPRKIRFALQAAPVKPNDSRYRTKILEGQVAHDTRGYRYWGDSVDSFTLKRDEDFAALRKFLLYGPRYQEHGKEYGWWVSHYTREIQEGSRIVMYGSTWMTGMGMDEFRAFGGEWVLNSAWKPNRSAASDAGRWNYGGTIQWTSDAQLSPTGVNWTRSFTDCFIYYHKPLIEKCGFNGTWWDNSSIGTVTEYDEELGRMDAQWNLIYRRDLCKRLNVLGWQLMRAPCWAQNMHVDMSWNQIFWMVENDWYADAVDMTSLQHWTLDEFRSMCRTKSTTLVAKPWLSGFQGTTPEMDRKVKRSIEAICLSHDVPGYGAETRRGLQYAVDLANTSACLFRGYWAAADAVQPAGRGIIASVYSNERMKSAVLVLMNTEERDQYLAGTTFDAQRAIGLRSLPNVRRVYDLESGEPVQVVFENGRFRIADPCMIPWHEFRLIAVEAQ